MPSKKLLCIVFSAILSSGCAAQDNTMSTVLGGLAGYGIADALDLGQGEAAAAAVAGAIVGSQMGSNQHQQPTMFGQSRPYYNHCARLVPAEYSYNNGVKEAWIRGCENKVYQNQVRAEQEAYQNAINTQ